MRTNTDYGDVWASLAESAEQRLASSDPRPAARRVPADGGVRLYLSLTLPTLRRVLLIHLAGVPRISVAELPSWRGLEIAVEKWNVEDLPPGESFLLLRQALPGTESVYEAVIAEVCASVNSCPPKDVPGAVQSVLERWRLFFSAYGHEGLEPEAQRGLFGEVWFIRDHLKGILGGVPAVDSWTGYKRAPQDFQFQGAAIEVKTSIARQHQTVNISNERQLDDHGLTSLHLLVLSLGELEGGETLPQLVDRLAESLEPRARSILEEKLYISGYIGAHAPLYTTGYVFRTASAFQVGEGFPRLVESDIPDGVGDVRYSVTLSACVGFRTSVEAAVAAFVGQVK